MWWVIGFCAVGIIVAFSAIRISTHNDLVKLRNKVKNSWANIDAQLQRRFDLVPNLVETVRASAMHEIELVDTVAEVLNNYLNARDNQEKIVINEQLTSALKLLYNTIDNYPQLKTNTNFLKSQSLIAEIEEDISYARQFYNDAVTIYNNRLMSYPGNVIASKYGFKEEPLFNAVKAAETAPKIQYNIRKRFKGTQCPECGAPVVSEDSNCKYCGCSLV